MKIRYKDDKWDALHVSTRVLEHALQRQKQTEIERSKLGQIFRDLEEVKDIVKGLVKRFDCPDMI